MTTTIRIKDETWRRLQQLATPFRGSERGTPDKVIAHLIDQRAQLADELHDRARKARDAARRHGQPVGAGYLDGWGDALDALAEELEPRELEPTTAASCGHDGWQAGCPTCEAEHKLATAILDVDDVPHDADRPPGTSGSWGEA